MLDLGTTFVASVARDPNALAIVDGELRLTYAQWYRKISALVAAFDLLGLAAGDHLVTVLTNRWEAATLHWACQFAGIIITPLNWRASADDLDFCLADADAKAVVYENVAAPAIHSSKEAQSRARMRVPGRQCSIHRGRRRGRKACRAGNGRSVPPRWRMWRRTSIANTNAPWA
jgi:2-furoate---CoA ligase